MLYVLAIVLGGILYRIPRGGPDREWWDKRGLIIISRLNEEIWALSVATFTALALGNPWPLVGAPVLWLGERPGYMHHLRDGGVDVWKMNLRGVLLLNPLLGSIYWFWNKYKPTIFWSPYMDGWTAWAELVSGFITAGVYLLIWTLIV